MEQKEDQLSGGGGGQKINATTIAEPFRVDIRKEVASMAQAPLLVGLLANDDPAAVKYAEWTGKAFRADGMRYEIRRCGNDPYKVEEALRRANADPDVHGILVYYPVFGAGVQTTSGSSHDDYLRDSVSIEKDVEGLCHTYRSNLYRNIRRLDNFVGHPKCILPCTPLAVVKTLEGVGCYDGASKLHGKTVTVINRSEIVGRPLAAMLANDGATVYSVDLDSIHLFGSDGHLEICQQGEGVTPQTCVEKSDIVITGVPTKAYRLPVTWVRPNTTVVNVSSYKNVDEASLLEIPGVKYVPLVGKVTVAMLERNLLRLYKNFHDKKKDKPTNKLWLNDPIQVYTALAVTAILFLSLSNIRK